MGQKQSRQTSGPSVDRKVIEDTTPDPTNQEETDEGSKMAPYRLEDVIDSIKFRVAGNGLKFRVILTVAWCLDVLTWHYDFGPRCEWAAEPKDRQPQEVPQNFFGVFGLQSSPAHAPVKIYNNETLIARGNTAAFWQEDSDHLVFPELSLI